MKTNAQPTRTVIKNEIIDALSHPEAEAGLYFENLGEVHEDEERNGVSGSQVEILDALRELIEEGRVAVDDSKEKVVFSLARN